MDKMNKKRICFIIVVSLSILFIILFFIFKSNGFKVQDDVVSEKLLLERKDVCGFEKKEYYTVHDNGNDINIYFICLSEVYINNNKKEPLYKYFRKNSVDDLFRYLREDLIIYSSYDDGNVVVRKGINTTIITCSSSNKLESVLIGDESIEVDENICN